MLPSHGVAGARRIRLLSAGVVGAAAEPHLDAVSVDAQRRDSHEALAGAHPLLAVAETAGRQVVERVRHEGYLQVHIDFQRHIQGQRVHVE